MGEKKGNNTFYKGYRFRSNPEAQWAYFMDHSDADWEYEVEGYKLGDGIGYLPDILVHNLRSPRGGIIREVYIEVKGVAEIEDLIKVYRFHRLWGKRIIMVGSIPKGETISDIWYNVKTQFLESPRFENVPNDFNDIVFFGCKLLGFKSDYALPCIDQDGHLMILPLSFQNISNIDKVKTLEAYHDTANKQFEQHNRCN